MTPACIFQRQDADAYRCDNTRVMGGIEITERLCSGCVFRQQPDFFTATSRLSVRESQPYRPAPRSCGTCGTVKRRTSATQFVWPYWHGGASGDELRWSVRSVERFFDGPVKKTLHAPHAPA